MAHYIVCSPGKVIERFERRTGAEATSYFNAAFGVDHGYTLYVEVNIYADVQTTDTDVEPVSREERELLADTSSKR